MSQIERRTFLKGVGTLMALPTLEAFLPTTVLAQTPAATPTRMAFLFVPNGINMEHWTPKAQGGGFDLPSILEPLREVKDDFNILTGLAQDGAHAHGDGPGDHARSAAAWLTGVHPKKTAGTDIRVGTSADQIAAQAIGQKSRFASLELGCERGQMAGDCDSGYSCSYSSSISWRTETTPNAKEVSPRLVFERLFGSGEKAAEARSQAERQKKRLSVIDFVLEDAASLKSKLGLNDQMKLEEYLTSIRDIEKRLEAVESAEARAVLAGVQIPDRGAPQDRGAHVRLLGDMMILAFQANLTRIATFMFANEGSNRPYREIEVSDGHHDISHHGNEAEKLEQKRRIDLYHAEQLAYILKKMKSIQEPGGTMLDNSMIVYGGGISDGNRHNHDNLPTLIAGRAGGKLKTGRHMVFPRMTPMNNLYISMLDYMGVDVEQFGDSTGKLQGLF